MQGKAGTTTLVCPVFVHVGEIQDRIVTLMDKDVDKNPGQWKHLVQSRKLAVASGAFKRSVRSHSIDSGELTIGDR